MARRSKSPTVASAASGTALEPLDAEIVAQRGESEDSGKEPEFTFKQRLFIEAYVGAARGNGTRAAEIAGYDGNDVTLSAIASENCRKPRIKAEIERRTAEIAAKIGVNELVNQFAEEAGASYEDFIDINPDGSFAFNLAKAKAAGKLHLIEDLGHDKETGAPVIKLSNRQAARMNIARLKGLAAKEQAPQGAAPVTVQIYQHLQSLPTEDIKRLREEQKQLTKGEG